MKRSILILIGCMLFIPIYPQFNDSSFNLPTSNSIILNVDCAFNNSGTLNIDINNAIYGLSVSGYCNLKTDKAYVRILLRDDCNYEHLVYENYVLLADSTHNDFVNIGIETSILDSIIPTEIQVYLYDAELYISNIQYITTEQSLSPSRIQTIRNEKNNIIANNLNKNLAERGMTWRAGTTFISSLSYEEKKTLFGTDTLPNLYGIEYYKSGVYVSPDYEYPEASVQNSPFVESFDWRNRHGKNWLTSVKSQGNCGNCWVMAPIDHVEAYINLYYNRILDYDLSEQEIVSCSYEDLSLFGINVGGCTGGYSAGAFKYIKIKGVVLEECLPYGDFYYNKAYEVGENMHTLVHYRDKCESPSEIIKIKEYNELGTIYFEDSIKSLVMKQPLTFSLSFKIDNKWSGHCMLMTGYKTIHVGDSICKDYLSDNIVQAPAEMDGTIAYIVKNCWGEDWGDQGYGYLVVPPYLLKDISVISGDLVSNIYNNDSKLCKDDDGDGYYFWGIGNRPTNLPEWIPNVADGDDSNAQYGPMNKYGYLEDNDPNRKDTIFITEHTDWNKENYIWQHVVIKNGGILNITSNIKFYKGVNILVENGGKLNVAGGYLEYPNIEVQPNGELHISNKGKIRKYKHFSIANGSKMRMVSGVVNQ